MPMTAFSRSTECHNQDKVSQATVAARQAAEILEMTERICAMHLLACCQAVELPGHRGVGPDAYRPISAYTVVREPKRQGFLYQDALYHGADLLGIIEGPLFLTAAGALALRISSLSPGLARLRWRGTHRSGDGASLRLSRS